MVIGTENKTSESLQNAGSLAQDFRKMTEYGAHLDYRASTRLSARERQVLELAGRGLTSQAIASHLQLRPRTIDLHYWKIRMKLGLRTQDELTNYAQRWVNAASNPTAPVGDSRHKLGGDLSTCTVRG